MSSQNRVIERTLYPPIVGYLNQIGFDSFGEAKAGRGASDVVFSLNDQKFVVETKLEKESASLTTNAIAQAFRYASKLGTSDIIVLIYPESLKNQPIPDSKWLTDNTLHKKVKCHIFTEYWTETLEETPAKIFEELKNKILTKNRKTDLHTVIKQIQNVVSDLQIITNYVKKDELVSEVVSQLDLFTSIGDIKDKKTAESQITNLSSYLLFNQLLFYRIYNKKVKDSPLQSLGEIEKVRDIQKYFDAITKIDFRSIYKINILGHIPDNPAVIKVLNNVIQAIKLIRADLITHDLAGRFFHDLIPFEVRKILAAFYTHPNSADLLAELTIDSWDKTVIDPACGSGTLLVASYAIKMNKYKKQHGYENFKKIHTRFLEKEITGFDIMPFASHLTTINLAMQEIDQHTNVVRIASMDSLELAPRLKDERFVEGKGHEITGYERSTQMTLTDGVGAYDTKKGGAVSMEGKGSKFLISPLDVVIMNPPFSDREKMPSEMRTKLNNNEVLNELVGGMVNLWGYFLGLSYYLMKDNGKMGAVIPISVARGGATQKVRNFLLNNFTAKFIIKPIVDDAFSENSAFRDVLYIAEKRKPTADDYTAFVSIKTSIKNMESEKVPKLADELKDLFDKKEDVDTENYEVKFMKTQELLDYSENLMPLLGFKSQKNGIIIQKFLTPVREKAGEKFRKITSDIMREGLHASPAGLSELVFVTNGLDPSRISRAFLVLKEIKKDSIIAEIKDSGRKFEIPLSKTQPALRTLTGVKNFIAEKIDFVIVQEPDKFKEILALSKWKGKFDWYTHNKNVQKKLSYVVVPNRFRPDSPNTHHFAFYSSKKVLSPHAFKIFNFKNSLEGLFQTLLLNSSITMANFLLYRSQSTRGFTHIMEADWILYDIFNVDKLDEKQKQKLQALYKKLEKIEFPSLKEQYLTNNKYRRMLDIGILEILGFEKSKIEGMLDKLYKSISDEWSVD